MTAAGLTGFKTLLDFLDLAIATVGMTTGGTGQEPSAHWTIATVTTEPHRVAIGRSRTVLVIHVDIGNDTR